MPLGSSSAAPVTIPGPIFERTRKTFGYHESNARAPNFGESLRIARWRSRIFAMEDILRKVFSKEQCRFRANELPQSQPDDLGNHRDVSDFFI
jgi:hypothetical protein